MICYRDMTFCPYYEACVKGDGCHRALTFRVLYSAEAIELPVCKFLEKPDCFEDKTP